VFFGFFSEREEREQGFGWLGLADRGVVPTIPIFF
jgi:hypothetical protein